MKLPHIGECNNPYGIEAFIDERPHLWAANIGDLQFLNLV